MPSLYKIYRTDHVGYDEYDSAVVVADTEERALNINPYDGTIIDWAHPDRAWTMERINLKVIYLGELDNEQVTNIVICASFNAG